MNVEIEHGKLQLKFACKASKNSSANIYSSTWESIANGIDTVEKEQWKLCPNKMNKLRW